MKKKRGLLRGGKFNGRHSTIIPDAEEFVVQAKKLALVSKISVGLITPCSAGPVRIKIKIEQHALCVHVRGRNAVQTFYLYGSDLAAIHDQLIADPLIRDML